MKILLATGIYPPQIGGPAQYAKNLAAEFTKSGHLVRVLVYKNWFLARTILAAPTSDFILALDTFSVGWPAALVAFIFRKKLIIRVGGDFLWESYVERTDDLVLLKNFYSSTREKWSRKEKIIFKLTSWLLGKTSGLIFTTEWQRKIWQAPYKLSRIKNIKVIANYIGPKFGATQSPSRKTYLFAARPLKLKNLVNLKSAFALAQKERPEIDLKVLPPISHDELLRQIAGSYAVLIPSISEVSPNLVWEAMSCNKPFILTKECGYAERLKNEALLVDPLKPNDLKEKVVELTDENVYRQKREQITAWKETHSWSEVAQDFLNFFSEI
jgi:glycosyltransferase involved in cell wall biosynthesis